MTGRAGGLGGRFLELVAGFFLKKYLSNKNERKQRIR